MQPFLQVPCHGTAGCVAANGSCLCFCVCRRRPSPKEQIVVTPAFATVGMETTQLTEENADFASRDRYHQSSLISREEFVNQFQ